MTTETKFFVVPAPGHFGNVTEVLSSYRTLAAARKAAKPGESFRCEVRSGGKKKGDKWYAGSARYYGTPGN